MASYSSQKYMETSLKHLQAQTHGVSMPKLPTSHTTYSSLMQICAFLLLSRWHLDAAKFTSLVFSYRDHTRQLRISLSELLFSANDSSTKGIVFVRLISVHLPHWCQWGSMDTADVQSSHWKWSNSGVQKYTLQQSPQLRTLSKEGQQQQVM